MLRPEIVDPELVVHDIFAYLLVAALTCLVAATLRPEDTLRQSLWFLIGFWIVAVAVQCKEAPETLNQDKAAPEYDEPEREAWGL